MDCAVAGNAQALVTEERHFQVLLTLDFPRLRPMGIQEFQALLQQER